MEHILSNEGIWKKNQLGYYLWCWHVFDAFGHSKAQMPLETQAIYFVSVSGQHTATCKLMSGALYYKRVWFWFAVLDHLKKENWHPVPVLLISSVTSKLVYLFDEIFKFFQYMSFGISIRLYFYFFKDHHVLYFTNTIISTLCLGQNGWYFADNIFIMTFLHQNSATIQLLSYLIHKSKCNWIYIFFKNYMVYIAHWTSKYHTPFLWVSYFNVWSMLIIHLELIQRTYFTFHGYRAYSTEWRLWKISIRRRPLISTSVWCFWPL